MRGKWVSLEPLSEANREEIAAIDARRQVLPEMGGPYLRRRLVGRFGASMAIREHRSGQVIGTLENDEMAGYPGVVVFIAFADPDRSRPGYAMDACALYIPSLFDRGAEILHLEVMSFNREMTHLLDRRHRAPDVRMRRHAYVAGRFWDLLIYGFDPGEFEAVLGRFNPVLADGHRRMAALGGGR